MTLHIAYSLYTCMSNPLPEPEEKTLDSTSALEKTLRLDRKHTNFDYQDPLRKYDTSIPFIF